MNQIVIVRSTKNKFLQKILNYFIKLKEDTSDEHGNIPKQVHQVGRRNSKA